MAAWWVAGGAMVFGLALVVAILMADRRRVPDAGGRAAGPPGLPRPDEIADPMLPIVWRGYAPVATDAHLDRVATAYAALYDSADDAARARADAVFGGAPRDTPPGEPSDSGTDPSDSEAAPSEGEPDPSGRGADLPGDAGRAPGDGIS